MSVFNPECTSNYFHVQDIDPSECAGGNPYAFECRIRVAGSTFGLMVGHGRPSGDEGRDQQGDDAREACPS